ncbi:MAG: hypothetical protein KKG03_05545 [Gammaproteobacteria bacterium]|nr:hypothetical protein [Sideroxydans sp.]MBU3904023.1 hypothetical protein [Gammaproteobacteria bacterium]MBU4151100.1 hypothetical protein [Gammaproteobacteria bacterium]
MNKHPNKNQPMSYISAANLRPDFLQNRVLLTRVEAGFACGWAKQTVYNKIYNDEYPIPTVEFGGRPMVRVVDLLEYIENLRPHLAAASVDARRAGRPTKAESISRKVENSEATK